MSDRHFDGLRRVRDRYVSSQLIYRSPMSKVLRERVYAVSVKALSAQDVVVAAAIGPAAAVSVAATESAASRAGRGRPLWTRCRS
jgi:hypothetical protein